LNRGIYPTWERAILSKPTAPSTLLSPQPSSRIFIINIV